jgi:O-antigen ligase
MIFELYRWVRTTGVGEITLIQGGFYRVFFQSHIYAIIAYFILLVYLSLNSNNSRKLNFHNFFLTSYFLLLTSLMAVNLLSFSRSNWLGIIGGFGFIILVLLFLKKWKNILKLFSYFVLSIFTGLFLIIIIVKFPYPNPLGGFSAADLLAERASQVSDEAGVSSRWSLLPPLWEKIKTAPFSGQGFGSTVTYKTADPRILESNPSGLYTTYAFEWGWLDIWLKLGIFGLLSYGVLLYIIIIKSLKKFINRKDQWLSLSLAGGLIAIIFINFFSPYLNHPLGIGYIIIISLFVNSILNIKHKNF